MRVALFLGLLALYSLQTARYLRVWRTDVTLWTHAAQRAPLKPRPWIMLAYSLLNAKRTAEASAVLDYAEPLIDQPHVPVWDRRDAREALRQNRGDLVKQFPE